MAKKGEKQMVKNELGKDEAGCRVKDYAEN